MMSPARGTEGSVPRHVHHDGSSGIRVGDASRHRLPRQALLRGCVSGDSRQPLRRLARLTKVVMGNRGEHSDADSRGTSMVGPRGLEPRTSSLSGQVGQFPYLGVCQIPPAAIGFLPPALIADAGRLSSSHGLEPVFDGPLRSEGTTQSCWSSREPSEVSQTKPEGPYHRLQSEIGSHDDRTLGSHHHWSVGARTRLLPAQGHRQTPRCWNHTVDERGRHPLTY
jgi:hypothetical protein